MIVGFKETLSLEKESYFATFEWYERNIYAAYTIDWHYIKRINFDSGNEKPETLEDF